MAKIQIELENCIRCPYVRSEQTKTSDWFEVAWDYYCTKCEDKEIAGYIERDWEMPNIPKWCPCLTK